MTVHLAPGEAAPPAGARRPSPRLTVPLDWYTMTTLYARSGATYYTWTADGAMGTGAETGGSP